jgi:hypothetical protein
MVSNNQTSVVPTPRTSSRQIVADPDAKPLVLADVLREMGMAGRPVKAKEIVGHTIIINRAKPFVSSFDPTSDAWFVVAFDVDLGEQVTTVLGGTAVVEILEAYAAHGSGSPLQVKLNWNDGGSFIGYYTFE